MPLLHRLQKNMPYYNAKRTCNNSSSSSCSGSETLRSSRSPSLASSQADVSRKELSRLTLLTSPFNPNKHVDNDFNPQALPNVALLFPTANSNFPLFPLTPASARPVTTSAIPHDCVEEYLPLYKLNDAEPDLEKWGGIIDFLPVQVADNEGALGTPLRDCLSGFGLSNPDERLFESLADAGKPHIELMIKWPGYPQLNWNVPLSIYGSDSLLVTKREMAHRIAVQYQNFALMCEINTVDCYDPRWRIGPGGYNFDRMRLSMLHWVGGDYGNTWQAYIRVLTDRDVDPNGHLNMRDILPRF